MLINAIFKGRFKYFRLVLAVLIIVFLVCSLIIYTFVSVPLKWFWLWVLLLASLLCVAGYGAVENSLKLDQAEQDAAVRHVAEQAVCNKHKDQVDELINQLKAAEGKNWQEITDAYLKAD